MYQLVRFSNKTRKSWVQPPPFHVTSCLWHICLEQFRAQHLSLNPAKCAFRVSSGAVLSHIVSREGIAVDPEKMKAIIMAWTPKNAKALSCFLGQIRWHNQMLRHLANFATPLHAVVQRTLFSWKEKDKAYMTLKFMLTQAPVIQAPDWMRPFHIFVDASNIAIRSALMQLTEPN